MAEIPNNHLGCKNPRNNGRSYQPQLVIAGFQPSTVVTYSSSTGSSQLQVSLWFWCFNAGWNIQHKQEGIVTQYILHKFIYKVFSIYSLGASFTYHKGNLLDTIISFGPVAPSRLFATFWRCRCCKWKRRKRPWTRGMPAPCSGWRSRLNPHWSGRPPTDFYGFFGCFTDLFFWCKWICFWS